MKKSRKPNKPQVSEQKDGTFFSTSTNGVQTKEDAFFGSTTKGIFQSEQASEDAVNMKAEEEEPVQKAEEEEAQTKAQEEPVQKAEEEEAQTKAQEEEEPVQKEEEEEAAQTKGEEEEAMQAKGEEEEEAMQAKAEEEEEAPMAKADEEEEAVQTKKKSENVGKPNPTVEEQIRNTKGQGKKLPKKVKMQMEQGLGMSFDDVNIHTDNDAIALNKKLKAQAFTHGNDIYFNKGKYKPETAEGKRLIAHELTHVVQQKGGK